MWMNQCGGAVGEARRAAKENCTKAVAKSRRDTTRTPDGGGEGRGGRLKAAPWAQVPLGSGWRAEGGVPREGRQGAGPSETPFVTWGCQEEAGIQGGPASLGGIQRLKGHGVLVSFLIGLLGLQPKRSMRRDGPGWTRRTEEARLLRRPPAALAARGPAVILCGLLSCYRRLRLRTNDRECGA